MSFSIISEWKQQFAELLKLPTTIVSNYGLILCLQYKNENNKLHRNTDIGPATIQYNGNGKKEYASYWINDQRHRPIDEGPAEIWFHRNDEIHHEVYRINDKKHRPTEKGPAVIWYKDGQIEFETYWVNDQLHRHISYY